MKVGELISQGSTRSVFEHPENKNLVIKKMRRNPQGPENKNEWYIWNFYKDTKYAEYLCPMIDISDDGVYLVAQKATKSSKDNKVYKKLPPALREDANCNQNWGAIDGKNVLLDYGRPSQLDATKKIKEQGEKN